MVCKLYCKTPFIYKGVYNYNYNAYKGFTNLRTPIKQGESEGIYNLQRFYNSNFFCNLQTP